MSEVENITSYCSGNNPTFLLTDFTDKGDVRQVVNYLNGLGNTSAINITYNGTTSDAISLKDVFKFQSRGAAYYYTSLLGAAFFGALAVTMVV